MDRLLQNRLRQSRNSEDLALEVAGPKANRANGLLVANSKSVRVKRPLKANDRTVPVLMPRPIEASNRQARRIRLDEAIRQRSDGPPGQENKVKVIEALPVESELSSAGADRKGRKDWPNPKIVPLAKLWSKRLVLPSSNVSSPTKAKHETSLCYQLLTNDLIRCKYLALIEAHFGE